MIINIKKARWVDLGIWQGCLLTEVLGHVHQEEAPAHKHSGVPLYMLDEAGRERGLGFSSNPVNGTQIQKSGRKWMDGETNKKNLITFSYANYC